MGLFSVVIRYLSDPEFGFSTPVVPSEKAQNQQFF
jgi:hypothetical protein